MIDLSVKLDVVRRHDITSSVVNGLNVKETLPVVLRLGIFCSRPIQTIFFSISVMNGQHWLQHLHSVLLQRPSKLLYIYSGKHALSCQKICWKFVGFFKSTKMWRLCYLLFLLVSSKHLSVNISVMLECCYWQINRRSICILMATINFLYELFKLWHRMLK